MSKDKLSKLNLRLICPSKKNVDTSDILSVKKFLKTEKYADILVINTGGPPAKEFFSITEDDWEKYFKQIFLSFVVLLQKMKIKNNGYVFLISSHTIQTPENNLVLSNSFRIAFLSVFKTLSSLYASRNISFINIAPGPIKTNRLNNLVSDMVAFEKGLPMKRAGDPNEIGNFIQSIIKNKIKYLTGVTIRFDGGLSKNIF